MARSLEITSRKNGDAVLKFGPHGPGDSKYDRPHDPIVRHPNEERAERHELSKVTSSERRALQRKGDEPRDDSFKSLTHKLEGEGKSAHYAQAIAGKVAKEKGDIGKKDAQRSDAEFTTKAHKKVFVGNKTGMRHQERLGKAAANLDNKPPTLRDPFGAGAQARASHARSLRDEILNENAKIHAGYGGKGDIGKKDAQGQDAREIAQRYRATAADLRHTAGVIHKKSRIAGSGTHESLLRRAADKHEGAAKDIEGMELDAQEKGDPWSDQNTRHDTALAQAGKDARKRQGFPESDAQHADDLDPDRIKRDLDDDRHEDADRAVEKSIERHVAKRSDEEPDMTDHDDLKGRIQALHDELDELESQLHGSDEPEGDEPEGDEPEGDEPSEDRNGEDEREAGEELAEGHEDVEHGDKAEGEELEHEAGEAEAEDRDHGDNGDDDVREHRGDQAPEDVAESVTEADAQSSRHSVGVKRSFNNRHDSNEDNDMTQRSDEDIRRRIDVLDARLKRATRSASYKERDELSKIRRRCDSVAQALGVRPEAPLPGEFPDEYRRRCAALLQPFSQSTKGVAIGRLDDAAFNVVEDRIYADAQIAAREPIKSLAGRLIPVESHDAAGRTITKYYGDPKAWMRPYMAPGVHIRFADSATRRNTGAR